MGSEYTNQHYVPQTYLKNWEDDSQLLWLFNKVDDSLKFPNGVTKDKIFYQKNLYTKTNNNNPILTKKDKEEKFKILHEFNISYNGKELTTIDDYFNNYHDFSNWCITKKDGSTPSYKKIKRIIEEYKSRDIEQNWSTIENNWDTLCCDIIKCINIKSPLQEYQKLGLITFMIIQLMRNPIMVDFYRYLIKNNDCFKILTDNTVPEEFLDFDESLFKSFIQRFQRREPNNPIQIIINRTFTNGYLHFYVANKVKFITSDNPVLILKGKKFRNSLYNGLLFPLTPNILVRIEDTDSKNLKSYSKINIPDKFVTDINYLLKQNSINQYISFKNNI